MTDIACPFRFDERTLDGETVATCGLLQQVTQLKDDAYCSVSRDACEACVRSTLHGNHALNDVFPSLLHHACSAYLSEHEEPKDATFEHLRALVEHAESMLVHPPGGERPSIASCDVFIRCRDDSETTRRSIERAMAQESAEVTLHLIFSGGNAASLAGTFASRWNVRIHQCSPGTDAFLFAVHQLILTADSQFVALQDSLSIPVPNRISLAVARLQQTGAAVAGSSMMTPSGLVPAVEGDSQFKMTIPWPTLVFRRDAFLDVGGFADRKGDVDVEWVHRARTSGAKVVLLPTTTVEMEQVWEPPLLGEAPQYHDRLGSLRHHGIGFDAPAVQCDVVLPIHGQLSFVSQAIESIVNQKDAEAIIHLIDDASPECTHEMFRYWGTHPRIRLYRNSENIGQFMSVNQVSQFAETKWMAIQDGDDISVPHRLHSSVNLLQWCDADYFAAAMEQFGEHEIPLQRRVRRSFYPSTSQHLYFAMNPTACVGVDLFRQLGGYADFGGGAFNRTGLDSEFMIRARWSGARFAISNQIVVRHRLHDQAATRNSETGFGTDARKFGLKLCQERNNLFRNHTFDPKAYGAIRKYQGITQRLS